MAGSRRMRGFINLIFLIAVIGLAMMAIRSVAPGQDSSPTTEVSPTPSLVIQTGISPSATPSLSVSPDYELIVLETNDGISRLVSLDITTKARQTLFTDSDEPHKIRQVGNVTGDGKEVLAVMGPADQDFGGRLVAVRIDGSGQTAVLAEQFASPWPPLFSPDGKKIAYVFFSNTEAQSGFFLVIANRDGSNKRELVAETLAITQPVFAPSGNEIAYFRSSNGSSGAIMAVKVGGGTPRELIRYENRIPYDLAWSSDGALAFVDGTGEAASLYEISSASNEPIKLVTPPGAESHPVYSPDAKFLAFTTTAGSRTTVMLLERTTGKIVELGAGTIVVGWREKGA